MNASNLRSKVIRLAHARPELRGDLLPVLKQAANYSQATRLIGRALKKARMVGSGRQNALKAILGAVTADTALMDMLKENTRSELLRDWFGQPLWSWRESWDLTEDDEYEDLTFDVVKLLIPKLQRHTPSGAAPGKMRDFDAAYSLVAQHRTGLKDLINTLSSGLEDPEEGRVLATAIKKAEALVRALKHQQ